MTTWRKMLILNCFEANIKSFIASHEFSIDSRPYLIIFEVAVNHSCKLFGSYVNRKKKEAYFFTMYTIPQRLTVAGDAMARLSTSNKILIPWPISILSPLARHNTCHAIGNAQFSLLSRNVCKVLVLKGKTETLGTRFHLSPLYHPIRC